MEEGGRGNVKPAEARVGSALRTIGSHPQRVLGKAKAVGEVQRARGDLRGPGQDVVDAVGVGALGTVAVAGST